jgi:hypothetical protein
MKNGSRLHKTGREPGLARLLRAAAQGREDLALATLEPADVGWAIATGLGPLLFATTRADPERESSLLWPRVHSAYLTARFLAAEQRQAAGEILEACAARGHRLVLLKGISIAHQHYPEPGLRPMRDVDILVADGEVDAVEAVLAGLGYARRSTAAPGFYDTHHHTMPLFEPRRGVWVEIHRALSSPKGERVVEDVLAPHHVLANLEPAELEGRRTSRLTGELQLVYIASHWAHGFTVVGGALALLDAIYLMKATAASLRWERLLASLSAAPAAAGHLYALLAYLDARGLVTLAPGRLDELRRRQRAFGTMNLRIVHAMIDRFLLRGTPPGPVLTADRLRIAWRTLFLPDPPLRNLARLPWRMRPFQAV